LTKKALHDTIDLSKEREENNMIIVVVVIISFDLLILAGIVKIWLDDCEKYGKENLAVSLGERVSTYFVFILFPSVVVFLLKIFENYGRV
jgi:hypothetical protein